MRCAILMFLPIFAGLLGAQSLTAIEQQRQSIARQQQSVTRQAETVATRYPAPFGGRNPAGAASFTLVPDDCPPVAASAVRPIIAREAERQNVPADVVEAVVSTESAFQPCAVSSAGAMGLMQLMPATAESLQVNDPFDPAQNITAGTRFLRQLLDRYGGDLALALAAYNAGPGRVDAAGGIPAIPETQRYVRKVIGKISPPAPILE